MGKISFWTIPLEYISVDANHRKYSFIKTTFSFSIQIWLDLLWWHFHSCACDTVLPNPFHDAGEVGTVWERSEQTQRRHGRIAGQRSSELWTKRTNSERRTPQSAGSSSQSDPGRRLELLPAAWNGKSDYWWWNLTGHCLAWRWHAIGHGIAWRWHVIEHCIVWRWHMAGHGIAFMPALLKLRD